VLDRELDNTLDTISGFKNPEIYHYQRGIHPGLHWYIKTIIPSTSLIEPNVKNICKMWEEVQIRLPILMTVTDTAIDWNDNVISGWKTIWLNNSIDIEITSNFDWKIVDYDIGLKHSMVWISSLLDDMIASRQTNNISVSYEKLQEIVNFLKTYTTDYRSKENRSKLRVISDDQIYIEDVIT
jgi:hypothetical protein